MTKTPTSDLLEAARLLEEELDHFGKLTRAIEKEPLSSRKSLDRAGSSLKQIADIEERLGPAMNALMVALTALQARHAEQTEAVVRRAEEIRQRGEVYRGLLERLGALVAKTGELNAGLGQFAPGDKDKSEMVAELDLVLAQVGDVTALTEVLQREAKELRFEDVSRQADGLSSQLGSAKSKLARLVKELSR